MKSFNRKSLSLRNKYVFFIAPIVALAISIIAMFGYRYMQEEITEGLHREMMLHATKTSLFLDQLLIKERSLAQGLAAATEDILSEMYVAEAYERLLTQFVKIYPETAGMGIWFKKNAFPGRNKAAPYVFRDANRFVASDEYTTNDFDIWTSEWYKVGTKNREGGWTAAYKDAVSGVSMTTISYPFYDKQGALMGCVTSDVDISSLKKTVSNMKVGYGGKPFLLSATGTFLAGASDDRLLTEKAQDNANNQFAAGIRSMLADKKAGFFEYKEGDNAFFVFHAPVNETGWFIVLQFNKDVALSNLHRLLKLTIGIGLASVIVLILAVLIFTRIVVINPTRKMVERFKDIAEGEGDLTMRLDIASKDELGELTSWFNIFMEKMQAIVKEIGQNTGLLDKASQGVAGIALELSSHTESASERANNVAASTEKLNANIATFAAAMEQATTNASAVGSASEEMSATISQIVENVQKASQISTAAVDQAEKTAERMAELEQNAVKISSITETITDISDKTNLLALNATIEAARAGEAGKGFAVVATEIKELAAQTAGATKSINDQISGIQGTSAHSISAINDIAQIIHQVNSLIGVITTSVEEQSATAQEIAENISQSNQCFMDINANINQGASLSGEISGDISQVSEVSSQIAGKSAGLTTQAKRLEGLAASLEKIVNSFQV